MIGQRMSAIVLAALVCGAAVAVLVLSSDHLEAKAVWAVFGPAVGWTFIGTGLYVVRRRPETRTGTLMARMEELRASRVRIVEASDTERRRLERNLHDGAQARLVGLAMLLGHARRSADADPDEGCVAALDGTLSVESPPGHGTHLHAEIPCPGPGGGPA